MRRRKMLTYELMILDTAYWFDLIRCIEFESASIVVEIDLTWSLGFVSVELAFVEARISLIKLEFSSCLFADSLMNLLRVETVPLDPKSGLVGTSTHCKTKLPHCIQSNSVEDTSSRVPLKAPPMLDRKDSSGSA
ncbi:hypothetical protein Tco_0576609 [Tanacetum coccineum]